MTQQNFTVDTGLTVTGTGGNITGATNIEAANAIIANAVVINGNAGDITMTGGNITGFTALVGNTANITLTANTISWTFDTDGTLTLPGEGVLQSINDTITLKSYNTSTGNANSVYLGTAGGLGFFDQAIPGNWLEIFRNGVDPQISTPGNLRLTTDSTGNAVTWTFDATSQLSIPNNGIITTANSVGTAPAATVNILGGAPDPNVWNTNHGGNVNIQGGFGSYNDGTGAIGGDVNLFGGVSPENTSGNVNIFTGTTSQNQWIFDSSGTLSAPGNITGNTAGYAIGYLDIPQVLFSGNATISATDAGKHYYSTLSTANTLTIANNTSVNWSTGTTITIVNRGTGNITVAQDTGVSLYLAGNSTATNRTVTTYGMATIMNVAANVWMINGTGVV